MLECKWQRTGWRAVWQGRALGASVVDAGSAQGSSGPSRVRQALADTNNLHISGTGVYRTETAESSVKEAEVGVTESSGSGVPPLPPRVAGHRLRLLRRELWVRHPPPSIHSHISFSPSSFCFFLRCSFIPSWIYTYLCLWSLCCTLPACILS